MLLREVRRLVVPELDVLHEQVEVRTHSLRVGTQRGHNTASDYALVERAAPFIHHLTRPQLVVLFEGQARFDEDGVRRWFEAGTVMLSDTTRAGTDAFGGARNHWLVLDWEPSTRGEPFSGQPRVAPIGRRDLRRLEEASARLAGSQPEEAIGVIVAILRAWGLGIAPIRPEDLRREAVAAEDARVHGVFTEQLSRLDAYPAISDLSGALGASDRHVHRRLRAIARRYHLPWAHWRAALHHARMLAAVRLLAAPGATTEQVARLAGFRAPSALCHAFDSAGLPSPGALARAARGHALDGWGDLTGTLRAEHAA